MEEWEKIIDELDKATNASLERFVTSMSSVSKTFYEQVVNAATQLRLRIGKSSPKAAEMADNLRKLGKLNAQLNKLLMESGYNKEVSTYVGTFKQSQAAINTYYSTIISSYSPSAELFEAIRKSNIETTVESLLNSGVNANFIEPVKRILKDVVVGNGDYNTLKKNLGELILGNDTVEPRLKVYVGQVSNDSIHQFQRNYMKAISDDLGLKHYLYAGTEITTTRDFCDERHGKYYTDEQVKSWASLQWAGKIKGTNEATIFTYCGGYRCRHRLLPVSETIYKAKTKK